MVLFPSNEGFSHGVQGFENGDEVLGGKEFGFLEVVEQALRRDQYLQFPCTAGSALL